MYTLYSMQRSGNSYKVRLALARLGIPYNLVEVDILKGESRTPEFLAKNPNGQVPLLEVAPDRHLAESNAILWYVAGGSTLAPEDRITRAEALQWMFFEQHSLEPNIGAAYFWLALIKGGRELQSHALEDWMENGYRTLGVMETHLTRHRSLRLHACRRPMRLRPQPLSVDRGLACASRRRAGLYPHELATGACPRAIARKLPNCLIHCLEKAPLRHRLCPNGAEPMPGSGVIKAPFFGRIISGRSCASTFRLQALRPRQDAPLAASAGLLFSPSL